MFNKESFYSIIAAFLAPGRNMMLFYSLVMMVIVLMLLQPATLLLFRFVTDIYSTVDYSGYSIVWVLILCSVIAYELLTLLSRTFCKLVARFVNWLILVLM